MKGINYDKKVILSKMNKSIKYGKYEEDENGKIKVISTVPEFMFYKIYLELNNVIGFREISGDVVDVKILDYTLIYRNKDSKLIELGKELNRSPNSVYASINRLRATYYLIKNEDNLFVPNDELRYVMTKTKEAIKKDGYLTFDYLFRFCIK
jgi:predicted transcriptional regulator